MKRKRKSCEFPYNHLACLGIIELKPYIPPRRIMQEPETIDLKLFRSLFRRTRMDWFKSLFRKRYEFEPCRIYHSWKLVHVSPQHNYMQCNTCLERMMVKNYGFSGATEKENIDWLDYRELDFRPKYTGTYTDFR